MKYENTTVGVPVFKRVDVTRDCLQAVVDYGFNHIVVADDGKMTQKKIDMYDEFREKIEDWTLIDMEYNLGVSKKRNKLVEIANTQYFLLLDNDMVIKSINHAYDVLESDENIGGVSGILIDNGDVRITPNDLYLEDGYAVKYIDDRNKYNSQYNYLLFDQIPQCGLFRMSLFDDYKWDESFKLGYEHIDFFLRAMESKWNFAFSPKVIFEHFHAHDEENDYTEEKTSNRQDSREYFLNKWDLKDMLVIETGYLDPYWEGRNGFFSKISEHLPLWLISQIQRWL